MTPRDIFDKMAADVTKDKAESIGGTFQFKITGDNGGDWFADFTKDADWIKEGTMDEPKCTITVSDEDWVAIVDGSLNAQMAFMSGKLKVAGDVALSLKLQALIS